MVRQKFGSLQPLYFGSWTLRNLSNLVLIANHTIFSKFSEYDSFVWKCKYLFFWFSESNCSHLLKLELKIEIILQFNSLQYDRRDLRFKFCTLIIVAYWLLILCVSQMLFYNSWLQHVGFNQCHFWKYLISHQNEIILFLSVDVRLII